MEEWKEIPGYEGLYEVSNMGNVRNVRRNKLLKLSKTTNGYIRVSLCKNGIKTGLTVHRLVAEAFIPNPYNLPEVNHRDEDKTNNRVDNLEFCDRKYNVNYGTRNIRAKETAIKNGYYTGLSKEEYRKKYRDKNKEKIREKQREYMREYNKNYYEENKEKIIEQHREYKKKNREKINEKNREYIREYRKKRKNK